MKLTKSDLNFLASVDRGEVAEVRGYKPRSGGYTRFIGGRKTYERLRVCGLVVITDCARLGFPAVAKLTDAGRTALKEHEGDGRS